MELAKLSIHQLNSLFQNNDVTPVDALEAALRQVDKLNPKVNAISYLDKEKAMIAAQQSAKRWAEGRPLGLLDGIPYTVKDSVMVKGVATRAGSLSVPEHRVAEEDGPEVARLREAGAVFFAKNTMPEFGWKGSTSNLIQGITRNPWDLSKTPGGSSGGAAVTVATGMGCFAIGSDGGGSIRIPASFTGIFGLKATYGRIAHYPPSGFGSLANYGPMTNNVTDCAALMNVLSIPDSRDGDALPNLNEDYLQDLDKGVAGLRIALSLDLGHYQLAPAVRAWVTEAAEVFRELGAHVEETHPDVSGFHEAFDTHWQAAAGQALLGVAEQDFDKFDPGLVELYHFAKGSIDIETYIKAEQTRREVTSRLSQFFDNFDLLLTPTLPITAFDASADSPSPNADGSLDSWSPFTCLLNMTKQPAASIPCGFDDNGLPVGLQIIGPHYADKLVLQAARAYEKINPIVLPDWDKI